MQIENKFEYKCSPAKLYAAISELGNIAQWWTDLVEAEGEEMHFHWTHHKWMVVMKTAKLLPDEFVEWHCIESNMQDTDAWKGSTLKFKILSTDGGSWLHFLHDNYKNSPCINECTAGWSYVLGKSLKDFVESGVGQPYKN